MKKLVFSAMGLCLSLAASAQVEVEATMEQSDLNLNMAGIETVNDTISPTVLSGCDVAPRTYSGASGYVAGGNTLGFVEVAQWLNIDSLDVDVYSLMVFTTRKEEGPSKGSFTGHLYTSTDSLTPGTSLGNTNAVSFDNIDTVNSFTNFPFPAPISVGPNSFFVGVDIDNGSDTIAIATTGPNCGGGTAAIHNGTSWSRIGNEYSTGGSPLDVVLYIFAEVENNSIGLDRNLISRSGLNFFPNPAGNTATIEFDMAGENEVSLYIQDMTGRTVYSESMSVNGKSAFELDLSGLKGGAYTYQLVGSQQQLNGVFVKK